jgi:hydroxymethylbilane synthase
VQANAVATALGALGAEIQIVPITTSGDTGRDAPADKSRFVKEIEDALLAGQVDLAVHSAKDVPGRLPDGLAITAVPSGEDPRDALVGRASGIDELPHGARVGTSSLRRRSQLLAINPRIEVLPLRGNVDTRLQKLANGEYDAMVLALAGLRRLGREGGAHALSWDKFVPAPGQGLLALETRTEDGAAATVSALDDPAARCRLEAERAVVEELDASCHTPVGAHARVDAERIALHAFVGLPDGREWITDRLDASVHDPRTAGRELARRLLTAGAGELLRRAQAVG